MSNSERPHLFPRPVLLLFLVVGIAVALTGWLYYRAEMDYARQTAEEQLGVIADLKVTQLSAWRQERLDDASLFTTSTVDVRRAVSFVENPSATDTGEDIKAWLAAMLQTHAYRDIMLVDSNLKVRLAVGKDNPIIKVEDPLATREAIKKCQPVLHDFHQSEGIKKIHLDLYAPLKPSFVSDSEEECRVALLIIVDPEPFLYPMIQEWPTPSKSGETLLVHRQGDKVEYLNELRHRKNTALSLCTPASEPRLPAAMALRGVRGTVEGTDYRGVPVLAALRAVPESPWFLIAKVDLDEVYAPHRTWVTLAMTGLGVFLFAVGVVYGLWWNRREVQVYRRQYETEAARRAIASRYEFLMRNANDVFILADAVMRIAEVNDCACTTYGYSMQEFIGMPLEHLRAPQYRADLRRELELAEKENGLVYETVHRRKDGTFFPVEISLRVLTLDGAKFYQSFIRDISERKQAELQVRRASAYARGLIEANLDALMTISAEGLITDVNRAAELVTGVAREQLIGSDFSVCFTEPEQAASVNQEVLAQGIVRDYPLTIRHTSGRTTDVLYNAIVHQSEHGEALSVFAAARDITERKKAEVELKKLNVSLEQRADQLRRLASDLTQAEEVERRRLSQLLHDHLQQLLVAAKLRLTIAFNLSAQHAEELRGTIQEVQTLLDQSVAASRTLTAELSPPILYDSGLAPALAWLSRWMEEKYGLQVQLDGDPEADPGTQELRILLFRSARELLFNVVKHAGVERAQVTLQRLIDGRIQLHVADEGAGFDQVDRLSPEKAGFGLLSVRERMELMGGTFAVDSSPGCGTRITLTISPIIITAKAEKVALVREEITLPPSIAADGERQAIRVLIADDHAVVRQGLAALLGSQADMQVVGEAGDGRAAVNLAREQSPDVVVMDVNMPLLDGVEATRIIAAELPRIKVIGLSVHAKQDMETRMREAGAVAYLDKSGPAEDLLDAIRKSVS